MAIISILHAPSRAIASSAPNSLGASVVAWSLITLNRGGVSFPRLLAGVRVIITRKNTPPFPC